MADKPDTISDGEWQRLQRAAADAAGGFKKTAKQQRKSDAWTAQRGRAKSN